MTTSIEDLLQRQHGVVTRRQLSPLVADCALESGVIAHVLGDRDDLVIADDVVYCRPDRQITGNDIGFLAPLVVATRDVPPEVVTPYLWESALLIYDVGVLDLPTHRGRDIAVPPRYVDKATDLAAPDTLTVHSLDLDSSQWVLVDGIPTQRVDLAIKHLADTPGMEPQWLGPAVADAFFDGLATDCQLAAAIDHYARTEHPEPMTGEQLVATWIQNHGFTAIQSM